MRPSNSLHRRGVPSWPFSTAAESTSSSLLHIGFQPSFSFLFRCVSPAEAVYVLRSQPVYAGYDLQSEYASLANGSVWTELLLTRFMYFCLRGNQSLNFEAKVGVLFCCGSLTDCFRAVEKGRVQFEKVKLLHDESVFWRIEAIMPVR